MKGIICKNSIKIIPEDSIEKSFLNTIYLFKSFYIRTERSIDFKVHIEGLERDLKKKTSRIREIFNKIKKRKRVKMSENELDYKPVKKTKNKEPKIDTSCLFYDTEGMCVSYHISYHIKKFCRNLSCRRKQ